MISDTLVIAIAFNLILMVVAYFAGYRALMIASSVVWAIIDLMLYQELEDKLVLAIILLIAAGQVFLPLRGEDFPSSRRR